MTPTEVKEIDDWRYSYRVSSRGEAIRRLCQVALAAQPLIMTEAMDQVETLSKVVDSARRDLSNLIRDIRDGKWTDTATPENVLADALGYLLEIEDHVYWLNLTLLDANNTIASLSNSPVAASKAALRRTRESIDTDREDFLRRRREGFENMLLFMASDALLPDERTALDEMDEDRAEAFLNAKVERLKQAAERLGISEADRLHEYATDRYHPAFEELRRIAREATSE